MVEAAFVFWFCCAGLIFVDCCLLFWVAGLVVICVRVCGLPVCFDLLRVFVVSVWFACLRVVCWVVVIGCLLRV